MNLYELTTAKLDQYTKAADADYEKAKAAGDYKKSLKRATGMMKASGKKIDNDVKALQKARGVAEGSGDKRLSIGQQMARDGITYSVEREKELIGIIGDYLAKNGHSNKAIRYYLSYDEDFVPDTLSELPKEGVAEATWINGKKQDDKELVWKQTSMSYEEACKKYGKENCKIQGKTNRGEDAVLVKVPRVAEDKAGWSIKGSPKPAPKEPTPHWRLNKDGTSTDLNTGITYNRDGSVKSKEGVAEGVDIVDQDSDLDQQVYTLMVDGQKVSFTYWDYENNFQSPDIKDIHQQAQEQLGKKISPEQVKAVARAVFKSFEQGVAEGTGPVKETALNPKNPKDDYDAKRRALQDLGKDPRVDQKAVQQRFLDLEKEAKHKGVAEGMDKLYPSDRTVIDYMQDNSWLSAERAYFRYIGLQRKKQMNRSAWEEEIQRFIDLYNKYKGQQGVAEGFLMEDPVTAFASKAHEEWRQGWIKQNGGKSLPREKKNNDGTKGDINVPFEKLHPDWQKENLAAGRAAMQAVKQHPNDIEAAAEFIHNEWMKRNPKADYNAAQHVPYEQLSEPEKEKDRVHVRTMMSLMGKAPEQGVAEGMFGIDSKTKGAIQNVVAKLSDIPNMWDHKAQTFTNMGKAELEKVLNYNPKYINYAVNLTADDFEADLDEMDRRGFLKGLGAVAATAAVPSLAQAGSAIDYNKVQMLHDQMFKKNPQYAKEWQAANGERVRAFIKSKDPKFRDRNTARKARLDMTAKILQKYGVKDLNENQFDPINDDDYYEYNVNTKEIVKHISGKHPIASKFNPLQKEWPGRDADHKIIKGLRAKYLKDDVVDEKVSDFIPDPLINKHSIVKGWRKAKGLDEKAPPGDKAERMVKHIKKSYAKDGDLTPTEKSIAYATAWKAHNAGKV